MTFLVIDGRMDWLSISNLFLKSIKVKGGPCPDHKLGVRAGKYKFGPGLLNTNWGPGSLNTNCQAGPVNTNWGSEQVNTKLGPGLINTNWWPGPGAKKRHRK